MKYNALLFGMNTTVIEDFFNMGNDVIEVISCSLNYTDILNHIKLCKLDMLIYCLSKENRDDMAKMVTVKKRAERMEIPFIIIGNQEDCEDFEKAALNVADFTALKPSTANMIQEQIVKFMRQLEAEKEAKLEEERKKQEEAELERLAEEGEMASEGQTEGGSKKPHKWRKHILIVDDDPHMLKVLKSHLSKKYDVATAISGNVALRFLQSKETDLILLDYAMPKMDGPTVLEKLHENPETKDIPVLFLTGASDKDKITKALSLNPQGYLLKPVDQETLLAKIQEQIG